MTTLTVDDMDVTIDSLSYGTFISNVEESGGETEYVERRAWNGYSYHLPKGYKPWKITMDLLVDTATATLVDSFYIGGSSYTIVIGKSGVFQVTYSNMVVESISDSMSSDEGLMMLNVTFTAPGLRNNRVQA